MTELPQARDGAQYVTIGVDRETFAVGVESVREILDLQPMARLPHAPPFLAGMIDVRGQGVPVVDLRLKLGLPPAAPTEHTRIVVLEVPLAQATVTMGMVADRVIEVTDLAEHPLEPPPELGVRWRSDYIRAIGRTRGAFVVVFDLGHLFGNEAAALLDPAAPPPL